MRSERISFPAGKKIIKAVVFGSMAVVPLLYSSGFLTQLLNNYRAWQALGGFPGDGTAPVFPDRSFSVCLSAALSITGLKTLLVLTAGVGLAVVMALFMGNGAKGGYDAERNFHYSDQGTYGTAGYMEVSQMKKLLEFGNIRDTEGTILGMIGKDVVSIPVDSRMNRNIAVFGASGSMKSRAFVRNMVFQSVKRGESLILTDPKAELYGDMAVYLEKNGYTVRVFNLIHPENSDRWNCIGEVSHDQMMAQICADVIIKNTISGKSDHFWDSVTRSQVVKSLRTATVFRCSEN